MKTNLHSLSKSIFALSLLLFSVLGFAQTWSYDFGTGTGTADNTNSGSGNTSFFPSTPSGGGTYNVRIGASGGNLVLANPGTSLGTGSEAQLNASSSNVTTNANKFGAYSWTSPTNLFYFKAKIRTNSTGKGTITFSLGSSDVASTTTDHTANYTNTLASFSIEYDNLGAITATRKTNGGTASLNNVFKKDTNQEMEVYANNSGSNLTYTRGGDTYTLSTRTWDLWVDGIKVPASNGLARANNSFGTGNLTGFSFFATNSNDPSNNLAYLYVDDLHYSTALPTILDPVTTWDGASWDNGVPNQITEAVIAGNYNTGTDGNFTAIKLTVDSGSTLNIAANTAVTVVKGIKNNGTVTVQSDGNLIQNSSTATYTGDITVYRAAKMKRQEYTLWGSPVANRNLYAFSPATLTNRFYKYDEGSDEFYNDGLDASSVFEPAIGYAVRAPNNFSNTIPSTFTGSFTGVPNTGNISNTDIEFYGNGYNLVANPYPSNINFQLFKSSNATVLENEAYFWTNINDYVDGAYVENNYAIYNASNDTGTSASGGDDIPTKIIKVGQGFLVQALEPDDEDNLPRTITFTNAMRTADNDGIFFNSKGTQSTTDRYWLRLTTPLNKFNTTAVVYKEGASNNYDDYDSQLPIVGSDSFYSIIDDKKLAIQGRYPFLLTDKVPLGIIAYQQGNHTITLNKKEGVFNEGQAIYLYDKLSASYTNLQNGGYAFNTAAGTDDTRFEIVYQISVLATDKVAKESVVVYRDGTAFVVKAPKEIAEIQVFDMYGRLIHIMKPNSKEAVFEAESITRGVYILKVKTEEGSIYTKKIIR